MEFNGAGLSLIRVFLCVFTFKMNGLSCHCIGNIAQRKQDQALSRQSARESMNEEFHSAPLTVAIADRMYWHEGVFVTRYRETSTSCLFLALPASEDALLAVCAR